MKILLVNPHPHAKRTLFSRFTYPSLTLKQLAALTPPDHSVEVVDERFAPLNFHRDYDVVGISSLTYNAVRGYDIAATFKKQGATVVFGGYHASLLPQEAKQHADSVVIGEAELTWPKLLSDIEHHRLQEFYRPDRLVSPEEIPPARHDIGSYNPLIEPIQASRGCPTGCEFCAMQIVEGSRFRGRPVDQLVEEIKSIRKRYLFFADASLTINPSYSKSLFTAMKEVNKYAECFGNINVLSRDDEFLSRACDAGIFNWYVGIESISQENIDAAGKGTNKVDSYATAIKKIKDHGMMVTGFFMFGFDFDTVESFQKTLQVIYELGFDEVSFSIVTPYPGTRLFERYDREGRIVCRDWSQYDEGHVNYRLERLTNDELLEGIKMMALDYYSPLNIIKRSFTNTNLNPSRAFMKLVRNISVRSFYLHEKLITS